MQATAVATVNATFDWVASETKRVMREVLDVRAMERRHTVTPPVARAQQADESDGDENDEHSEMRKMRADKESIGFQAFAASPIGKSIRTAQIGGIAQNAGQEDKITGHNESEWACPNGYINAYPEQGNARTNRQT